MGFTTKEIFNHYKVVIKILIMGFTTKEIFSQLKVKIRITGIYNQTDLYPIEGSYKNLECWDL